MGTFVGQGEELAVRERKIMWDRGSITFRRGKWSPNPEHWPGPGGQQLWVRGGGLSSPEWGEWGKVPRPEREKGRAGCEVGEKSTMSG